MSQDENIPIKIEDIESLVEIFQESSWDELRLSAGGFDIFLSRDPSAKSPVAVTQNPAQPAAPTERQTKAPQAAAEPAPSTPSSEEVPPGMAAVRAPNLGVFYTSPKPDADPYVEVGDAVEEDMTVGLVEVMKLFTSIHAGTRGTVKEIRVENGQMVEFDQVLMLIEPADD